MTRRFDTHYKTKRLDNLGAPDWHDRRWADIDQRLHTRELDATKIDDAIDRLESVALARLDATFSPIIQQAQQQLADVGVSFSGHSLSSHVVELGAKTFVITEEYRVGLVVVDFVSIRPTGIDDTAMICSVLNYNRQTGALLVEPQAGYITGTGTYADWQIRVSVTPNLDTYSREEVDGEIGDVVDQIDTAIINLIDGAPVEMNTLRKIAEAIGGVSGQTETQLTTVLRRSNNLSDLLNAATARANIGLGSVNNTADVNKPVSSPQQAAINAVVAATLPVGTTMLFYQAVVPTGWIRSTTHNDKTIRVVSGTGGGSGGVQPWSTVFGRTTVDNTTLDTNTLPSHTHGLYDPSHVHGVADYQHVHAVSDPGHGHGMHDPGHAHGVSDPSHGHGVADPGHSHGTNPNLKFIGEGGVWFNIFGGTNVEHQGGTSHNGTGIWIYGSYTGIGIHGSGTGQWIHGAGVGVGVDYRYANIGIYGANTGQSVYAAGASWGHSHGIDLRCQYVDVLIGVKT